MKRTKAEHSNNLVLAFLNLVTLAMAGLLLEYETAKAAHPEVAWPATPSEIVFAVAGTIAVGSLIVLAILALIYKKGLYNRPYLWWITGFTMIMGATTLLIIARGIGLSTLIHFVLFP